MTWYAIAFDVAGGIAEWSGPHRWTAARRLASRWDQSKYVRATRVSESLPSVNKRYLHSNSK